MKRMKRKLSRVPEGPRVRVCFEMRKLEEENK